MYDYISPLSENADFYAADDPLTSILRPPLIEAQREISALANKRQKTKETLAQAQASHAAAFPTKAETWGEKLQNAGKATGHTAVEAKIKTELAVTERRILGCKQQFGLALFDTLVEAEDNKGYLPSDRQVRSIYDTTRGDIQRLEAKKNQKMEELGYQKSHL